MAYAAFVRSVATLTLVYCKCIRTISCKLEDFDFATSAPCSFLGRERLGTVKKCRALRLRGSSKRIVVKNLVTLRNYGLFTALVLAV